MAASPDQKRLQASIWLYGGSSLIDPAGLKPRPYLGEAAEVRR